MIKNKVIIVGGDHHNGLNLARMFGRNKITVISIVISDNNYSFMSHSKYISEHHLFHSEKEAFDFILQNYKKAKDKMFLIPYSDGAAQELDLRLDEFSPSFYVPSINNIQGEIARLMNKKNQYDWAIKNGIKMARSEVILLAESNDFIERWKDFPCILKPIVSAQGQKGDIAICENETVLKNETVRMHEKGYESVLIQPYLKIDYEIDVFGCICKNEPIITLVPTETIRAFPNKKGTNCFSRIIVDELRIKECKRIISKLQQLGFYGLYDIELLVVNGEIYLNEINFRNSGDDYMVMSQDYMYPLIWMNDYLGISNKGVSDHMFKATYAMTFWYDYQHVKHGEISFKEWLKDVRKTSDFALYYKGDMKPVLAYYYYCFIKKMKRILKKKRKGT